MNLSTKFSLQSKMLLFGIFVLLLLQNTYIVSAADGPICTLLNNGGGASDPSLVSRCINEKIDSINYKDEFENIKKEIDFADLIKENLDDEMFQEFIDLVENEIGMSIAGLVVLIIFVLSLPSLLIIGAIFLCCWGFKICCFSKKYRYVQDRPMAMAPMPMQQPFVPPKSEKPMPLNQPPSNVPPLIPRFTTKPSNQPLSPYPGSGASNTSWRNQPAGGHSNPSYQPQTWGDY